MSARVVSCVVAVAALVLASAATASPSSVTMTQRRDGQITKVHLRVEGIACESCSQRLRDALRKMDGVKAVEVDRARNDLAVEFDAAKTTEQQIRLEVVKHGFTIK